MLKELKKNKMSVVATGILFGVMGVLIIPMIAVIIKISNALSQKHPRIYKYSMIAFIGMLLAISLFCVVIKHQMSFLVIVACLAITLCDTIKNRWVSFFRVATLHICSNTFVFIRYILAPAIRV